jgi:restriction system protein
MYAMGIPDFQSIMLPLLQTISDGKEYRVREAVEALSATFGLSDEERSDLMPSGTDSTFNNRVRWAAFHLQKAELLHKPRRGYLKITGRGRSVLEANPATVDLRYLKRYPEYVSFREKRKEDEEVNVTTGGNSIVTPTDKILDEQTPEEAMVLHIGRYAAIWPKTCWSRSRHALQTSLTSWSWTCWSAWVTAAPSPMRAKFSPKAATVV